MLPELGDESLDDEEREELGIVGLTKAPIGEPLDPLPGFVPAQRNGRMLPVEPADVIETAKGIELYRHPSAIEAEHPELARYLTEFRALGPLPLTRDDYRTLPARYVDAWLTMLGAHRRTHGRREPDRDDQ